jgi:hypothetical protein
MTAGMTTQKLDSRVSLPRAGLGALLAATLLAGGLIGAAAYAGIGVATAQPAAISMTLERESTVVRDLRIEAGRGQLIGETDAAPFTGRRHTTNPATGDGFDHGGPNGLATNSAPGTKARIIHAPGHGPLR